MLKENENPVRIVDDNKFSNCKFHIQCKANKNF